jgi:hypothetical protein
MQAVISFASLHLPAKLCGSITGVTITLAIALVCICARIISPCCAVYAAADIPRTVQEGRGAFGGYAVVSQTFDQPTLCLTSL